MEISCSFGTSNDKYTCNAVNASIVKPNCDIVSFKGNHQPGKNNKDVSLIFFNDSQVEHFPRNLQGNFPNLNALYIINCGLREISRQDLIGLENLFGLSLCGNELKSLPDDLLKNMPNLKRVALSSNKIEFASSKLIEPVANQLEFFDLSFNTSINECYHYHTGVFSTCKTIQNLMAKIDEKCKPPELQLTSNALHNDSSRGIAAQEMLKGLNEFRRLGRFTDFVIIGGTKEFPVNKNILASQSSVFADMFEVNKNGRFSSKLAISGTSQQAVEAFLNYLYECKQPDMENAAEVFNLADKYNVVKLKKSCEQIIRDGLNKSNAFEVFKLASGPLKSEELKAAAFRILQESFGHELGDDLINNPENLGEIVKAKTLLDDLVRKSKNKEGR